MLELTANHAKHRIEVELSRQMTQAVRLPNKGKLVWKPEICKLRR